MNKVSFSNKFIVLWLGLIFASFVSPLFASDEVWSKPNSALIRKGEKNIRKIPLILIHGIHGTEICEERIVNKDEGEMNYDEKKDYWKEFKRKFRSTENSNLREKYELYIFQYCSDLKPVFPTISNELGNLIDENIADRQPVILAHSMGGLVAKAYMVYYRHSGKWQGKSGGDTTLGLITLATLHHGTPGATDFAILEPHTMLGWENTVQKAQKVYWSKHAKGKPCDIENDSTCPNRSDLRWDNFDNSFDKKLYLNDDNKWLILANQRLTSFYDKIIAYGGFLRPGKWSRRKAIRESLPEKLRDSNTSNAELLEIANDILVSGFNRRFGDTDGLVPFKSALLCTTNQIKVKPGSHAFCDSPVRVRRFEPGTEGEVANKELPYQTLSITRNAERGYDHEDMYNCLDVLNWVMLDLLKSFNRNTQPALPPPIEISKIPTLFLFDVSGSMNENGKINQARDAGLDALREMREADGNSSAVSIMSFSGDSCGGNVVRNLLPFTNGFGQAENVMRSLPSPSGGTPLPQAKDAAAAEMQRFLAANANVKEGGIVLLSDGQSTCGAIRPAGVYSRRDDLRVSRSDSKIKFFTIGLDVPAGSVAERDLQFLASETGGKYFPANDRRQLIRAFQKQVRRFAPRSCNASNADFSGGLRAFADSDYNAALESFQKYAAANPNDSCGVYNLALAFEANDRYKTAAETYRQYLNLTPTSPDRAKIEQKIAQLGQDYTDQFDYFIKLIQSDTDYLKRYYQSIFNRSNADLAQEFNGFVIEKGGFYKALPEILETNERWLVNDAKDISSSIDTLARRTRLQSFDRDAVSLLTVPIAEIEDLLERLRNYQTNNIR